MYLAMNIFQFVYKASFYREKTTWLGIEICKLTFSGDHFGLTGDQGYEIEVSH
jgi:hypothetical protein